MPDKVIIQDLEVQSRIGITAEERSKPQRLSITLEILHPLLDAGRSDNLRKTNDYDAVARRVRTLAGQRERNLIETLAEELAAMVLKEFRANTVLVRVKKYVLADAQFTAVEIERQKIGV